MSKYAIYVIIKKKKSMLFMLLYYFNHTAGMSSVDSKDDDPNYVL
jgi:hypothetical protein